MKAALPAHSDDWIVITIVLGCVKNSYEDWMPDDERGCVRGSKEDWVMMLSRLRFCEGVYRRLVIA